MFVILIDIEGSQPKNKSSSAGLEEEKNIHKLITQPPLLIFLEFIRNRLQSMNVIFTL